ncbi:ABC transporter permease [Dokdonia sp. Hel_I_53]|uniref:ABC transporter permease n=1 Tax=Dokdonia sp. Hel_I_53 TaxID=1566287 RepID=UPI00119AD8E4|nr:ABC transporter permease [Dokdonia sp. Hel_I_53]TVZ51784.1 ABC-type transport system involved in multi-copper enzyme maturation permease subunit [Dokdonia sp. Hel_I_53]
MLRLLTIEYHKLKHSRTSKVLIIGYFILLSAIALLASIKFNIFGAEFRLADQGIFNFPYIWHFNTFMAAILKFFLAVVIVSMTANEYSNRTLKQNLIDGLSKKEFILSKFVTVIVFSAISTIFIFILNLILGFSFSDFNEASIVFTGLEFLFGFFLKLVAFFSFCLFLGILIKRSAFALGFLLFWWIFEWIIWLGTAYVSTKEIAWQVWDFLPLGSMWNLINEPFTRLEIVQTAATQLQTEMVMDYGVEWYEIAIVCVWIFIFIYSSFALLKKRDL